MEMTPLRFLFNNSVVGQHSQPAKRRRRKVMLNIRFALIHSVLKDAVLLSCAWALVLPVLCGDHALVYGVTVEEILDAWQNYDSSLETARFKCAIERTELPEPIPNPIGVPGDEDTEPVKLLLELSVNIFGEKVALTRRGEALGDEDATKVGHELKVVQREQSFGFDGRQNWGFSGQVGSRFVGLGKIELGAEAQGAILEDIEMQAIWVACSPLDFFKHEKFKVSEIKIAEKSEVYNGMNLMKLSLPPRNLRFGVVAIVDEIPPIVRVEPERGYRVRSFEIGRKDGSVRLEITLSYKDYDKVGWRLGNWRTSLFSKSGDPRIVVTSEVAEAIINEPVSDSLFKPVFPVGTHVRKFGEPFIQGPDGKLQPMKEEEFGKIPRLKLSALD
jgi:hypothetical protein